MTEMIVIVMIWLGIMTPNQNYTFSEAESLYLDNVCEVNEVLDTPSQYSGASSNYYSNVYDTYTQTMINGWISSLKRIDTVPCGSSGP